MKKTITIASLALIAMTSCSNQTGYTITGTVSDSTLNGETVYLVDINGDATQAIDSAKIENLSFSFTKKEPITNPTCLTANLGRMRATILVEEGTVANVTLSTPPAVNDNGGNNDKLAQILSQVQEKGMQMREAYGTLMQSGASQDSIQQLLTSMQQEMLSIYKNAIESNKDNILGGYLFAMLSSEYPTVAELDAAAASVKYAYNFEQTKQQKEKLKALEKSGEGSMFIDFDGKNIDGTPAKLSDFVGKGKYVLADFWASWCGPCRREIPNLRELEEKFGGEKFMVLGINVWDQEAEFKKALEAEGINYAQLYASDNQEATKLYGITGIPQIMLFGPDGKIIKRDLRGEAMKAFVAELMGK